MRLWAGIFEVAASDMEYHYRVARTCNAVKQKSWLALAEVSRSSGLVYID